MILCLLLGLFSQLIPSQPSLTSFSPLHFFYKMMTYYAILEFELAASITYFAFILFVDIRNLSCFMGTSRKIFLLPLKLLFHIRERLRQPSLVFLVGGRSHRSLGLLQRQMETDSLFVNIKR